MTPEQRIKAYGMSDSLPKQTILKAGQLEVTYEYGAIRWIRLGNTEILRMVYSAVRDRNWGTIEPKIETETIEIHENSFDIRLKVNYDADPIHFSADYRISGTENKIRFEMDGTARSTFLKNRIGFCILHPLTDCVGRKARVIHPDRSVSDFSFPEQISSVQPAQDIQSITWEPQPGIEATLNLTGDVFEMEDHRNWTDASFKTYCTPLSIPYPVEIRAAETVSQLVELTVETSLQSGRTADHFEFSWNPDQVSAFPELGTTISSRKETLAPNEIELLKKLPAEHIRVELKPWEDKFSNEFEKAAKESHLLGWPLFVALYLSLNWKNDYRRFTELCREMKVAPKFLLPLGKNHLPFTGFDELEHQIRQDFQGIQLGTGVNAYFAELNRNRPAIEKADFVSFTICPQVHSFDHASLVENLEAQAEVIKSAQKLFPGKPIFISPVSLRQRFNVVATAPEPEPPAGTLPSSVDVRQPSVFAASWTLGSLKFLAQSETSLITFYETVGWKGLIQGEIPPDCPEKFSSKPDDIFPVYESLKEISGYRQVIHSHSSHPLRFDGLVVKSESEIKLFLFSFSPEDLKIRIGSGFQSKRIRSLLYPTKPEGSEKILKLRAWDLVIIRLF